MMCDLCHQETVAPKKNNNIRRFSKKPLTPHWTASKNRENTTLVLAEKLQVPEKTMETETRLLRKSAKCMTTSVSQLCPDTHVLSTW